MLQTVHITWDTTDLIFYWSEENGHSQESVQDFWWRPAWYEILSFPSDSEEWILFTTGLWEKNALADPKAYSQFHIHLDIHKWVEPKVGSTVYTHLFVRLRFSPRKHTLQNTVVQKLNLFYRWHRLFPAFTRLLTEKGFSSSFPSNLPESDFWGKCFQEWATNNT